MERNLPKTKIHIETIRHRMINYKIMHKNYASDHIVSYSDPDLKSTCSTCNTKMDIVHIFSRCKEVELFWKLFETWVQKILIKIKDISINERMKLLGTLKRDNINGYFALNLSLLHSRIFIHKCQVEKKPLSFIMFLHRLKKEEEMEKC